MRHQRRPCSISPVFPGKRYLDWSVPDPAGEPLEVVREIRDQIRGLVERFLAEAPSA